MQLSESEPFLHYPFNLSRSPPPTAGPSRLRSLATCLDADVVTTAPKAGHGTGVSLARFEVEIARGAVEAAAAAATATATGAVSPSRRQSRAGGEEEGVDRPAVDARLAAVLSSTIAASIRAADGEEKEQRQEAEEWDEKERTGGQELRGGSTGRDGHPQTQQRFATNARVGVAAEAEAEVDRAGRQQSDSSACGGGTSTTHRELRREPLARRQGCFFLAEADANALGSNGNSDAFSFGGGGGGGSGSGGDSGGGGDGARPFGGKSNDAGAFPNVSNIDGNNNDEARNNSGNNAGNCSPWTSSAGNSSPATTGHHHNNSPNDDYGGESCYPTIPTEDIELLELAGKGRFSRTYRARWRGATVAVKTLELPPESGAAAAMAGSDRSVIVAEFERELVRENYRCVFGSCV